MKPSILLSAALASSLLLCNTINAQTVATDPVGFNTVTIASGKIGALSLPLDSLPAFTGPVSSAGTNTITTTGANFGTFAPPHVVRMLTGASAGRQYSIVSNTSDTLTVSPNLTGVGVNDRYSVMAVRTLASLFGATAPALNRNANPALADNVFIRGTGGYLTYYNDGTKFLLVGGDGETAEDNTPIMPESGILFLRRLSSDFAFTLLGAVPVSNLVTDLLANRITLLGNRFPVATTLVGLGLHTLPGWNSNASPSLADNILIRGSQGYLTYYYDGAKFLVVGGDGETAENPPIAIGTSVLVVRRAGSTVTLNQGLPYTL